MKRKAFGFLGILLVIFQLFSPYVFNLKNGNFSKNVALAAATRQYVSSKTSDAFLVITGIEDKKNISVSAFTDPNYKITSIDKIEFVSDEKNDREVGCQADTITLVSNPSISSPKYSGFSALHLTNTEARGYLRQDFVFNIPNDFTAACLENNAGSDAWGHYKFYYKYQNASGATFTVSEPTETGESVEPLADTTGGKFTYIKDSVFYIKAQKGAGNNFDVEWGEITEKDIDENSLYLENPGNLKIEGDSTNTIYYDSNKTPVVKNASGSPIKVKFLQDGKEHTLNTYSNSATIDTSKDKPQSDGHYQLTVSALTVTGKATMAFDPNKETGSKVTWVYLNSATPTKITKFFNKADWEFRDYSIVKENTKPALDKNGEPVLDVEVSLFISKHEGKDFEEYKDVGTEKGKVDSKDQPNDWLNFMKDGTVEIDTRKAEDRDGFTLVYSTTENSPEVDNKDGDVNLNEYIFGEKSSFTPVILGKDGMSFVVSIPVGSANLGKTYYLRLYARDNDSIQDDYGYSEPISITIPGDLSQITQNSRDGEVTASGDQLNNASEPFLPKCGLGFWPAEDGTPTGCLIVIFYYLFFVPTSFILGVAGQVLDFVLVYSISPTAYKATYIIDSWKFVRDVCNLFFIFMLIYLAFKIILNIGHGTKQLIVNTLIIATVINFSYPLTTVVIDVSNITARQLYYNAFERKDADSKKPIGLSATAASAFNPQKIILEGLEANQSLSPDDNKSTIFMILLLGVIFNVVAILMFLKIALQFIYRILGLIFAIILSPFAVFSYSLDGEQRKKLKMAGFDSWFNGLIQDAFKAPVFLFFILIMTLFVANNPFKSAFGTDITGVEWWMSIIIPFMLIMAFLGLITSVTKSMSSSLAQLAGEGLMKAVGAVAGIAAGGIGLAGAGLIGKGATALANSNMGQRIMDRAAKNNGLSGFIARQQARALRGMQTGSYDLRQNRVANAISAETGANFNLGASAIGLGTGITAGGYMAAVERRNKKRDEFVQMLEWNKNLMNEMKDRKAKAEDSKAEKETLAKDQRAALAQSERDLKQEELNKKEVDERIQLLEKLEELFAKRADAIATGKPVSEIDVQINRTEDKLNNGNTTPANSLVTRDPAGAVVGIDNTRFTNSKAIAIGTRDATKARVDSKKAEVETAKDSLKTTEDSIRELDKDIQTLTKAIKKVKEDRKNGYNWRIRNKSGHIFKKATYGENKDGTPRALSAEESRVFANHYQGGHGDFSDQMRNIITSVDEHSHEVNNAFNNRVRMVNTALGALAGAFTGGAGAIAVGALSGGVVGIARSYRPDNEHYGVPHEEGEWHPHAHDNYRPPSGGGGGGGHGGGHDDHGGHH